MIRNGTATIRWRPQFTVLTDDVRSHHHDHTMAIRAAVTLVAGGAQISHVMNRDENIVASIRVKRSPLPNPGDLPFNHRTSIIVTIANPAIRISISCHSRDHVKPILAALRPPDGPAIGNPTVSNIQVNRTT